METLVILETKYTPKIELNTNGTLSFIGKSYPENSFEFYAPITQWIEDYFEVPNENTTINFKIIYFNSSSSKLFFDLFDFFEQQKEKSNIVINWIYDAMNESALEAGEDFIEDFETLNIQLIEE